jgi:sirohydrochlorin ferrochelatase
MELAEPSIEQAVQACAADGVEDLFVHPFFLVPGLHSVEDVPRLVEAAARAHPRLRVRMTASTGSVAGIADLILATLPTDRD